MPGVAVRTKDYAGGKQLAGNAIDWFKVEDEVVVCLHDPVEPHFPFFPKHTDPKMAECFDWWTIDGIGVCCEGHKADCGHPTTGRGWFSIG